MLGSHKIPQARDPHPLPFRGGDPKFQTLENKSHIKKHIKNKTACSALKYRELEKQLASVLHFIMG